MSQSALDQTQTNVGRYPIRSRKPIQTIPSAILTAPTLDEDARGLLNQINEILVTKAPEAIPLLQQFLSKLPSLSLEVVESEKRERSIVLLGVPEAEKGLPASRRQEHTEKYVSEILDFLDIEARPVEVFRMGKPSDKPRLVKVTPGAKTVVAIKKKTHAHTLLIKGRAQIELAGRSQTKKASETRLEEANKKDAAKGFFKIPMTDCDAIADTPDTRVNKPQSSEFRVGLAVIEEFIELSDHWGQI
ncbi:hypothetical protein OSTOST_15787 [Ostertagia ostertagi]